MMKMFNKVKEGISSFIKSSVEYEEDDNIIQETRGKKKSNEYKTVG